jgi:hypothetical protein
VSKKTKFKPYRDGVIRVKMLGKGTWARIINPYMLHECEKPRYAKRGVRRKRERRKPRPRASSIHPSVEGYEALGRHIMNHIRLTGEIERVDCG